MSGKIVSYTSDELKRLPSKTDWERLRRDRDAGIEPDTSDPDDAEITEAELAAALATARRGRPAGSGTKISTTVRFDADVIAAFRATGRGWQTRMNEALREWLKSHAPT